MKLSQKDENTVKEAIGWLGSLSLSFCGVPEVIKTVQEAQCGVGWGMLNMWLVGEILMLYYTWHLRNAPLRVNYLFNILCIAVMVVYKLEVIGG